MIMLSVKYGLRSGDVVNLKFEDIDWENKIIRISQNKTKRDIKILLLPEVGNAIIGCLFFVFITINYLCQIYLIDIKVVI